MMPQLPQGIDPTFFDPDDWIPNKAQSVMLGYWMSDQHKIMAMMGGWGCGKTTMIPMVMSLNHSMRPGQDGLVVSPTMGQGTRTISKECARILSPIGWTYHHSYLGQPAPHWLSPMKNGKQSRVWMMSWNRPKTKHTSANSLEGPSVGYIIFDECNLYNDEEPYQAGLGRIRDGNPPKMLLLGKPHHGSIWGHFAETRGGVYRTATSWVNAKNLGDMDAWISTMSTREYQENIMCNPQPPEGSIFDMWMPTEWPKGNLAPADWRPQKHMTHHLTFDFGVRNPAALVIAYDQELDANIVWSESMGSKGGSSVFDVCRDLRRGYEQWGIPGVWPGYRADIPDGSMPLSAAFGDRAGRNRRDDGLMSSSMDDVLANPHAGGIGMRVRFTDAKDRIDVNAGIRLLWSLIESTGGKRRLLCSRQLWNMGLSHPGRSFARSINDYRWASGASDRPDKTNGADHACDALRYWAINARWPSDTNILKVADAFSAPFSNTKKTTLTGVDR